MCSFNVFSVVHRESLYLSIFVYMDSLRASATLLSSSIFFYFKCYIFQFQHFHYILFHSFCFILFCFSRQLTQLLSKSLTFHSILLSLAPLSLSYACMFQGLVRNLDKLHTEILVFPSAALSSFRNTPPLHFKIVVFTPNTVPLFFRSERLLVFFGLLACLHAVDHNLSSG